MATTPPTIAASEDGGGNARAAGSFWELEKAETHSPLEPPEGVSAGPSIRAQGDPVWIPSLDFCPPNGKAVCRSSRRTRIGTRPGALLPSMPLLRAAPGCRLRRGPTPAGLACSVAGAATPYGGLCSRRPTARAFPKLKVCEECE